jgi:hypothetical protein
MGTLHLFLLHMKTFYETIDISLVSPQFIKQFLGSLIGEKTIQIVSFLREEGVEVDLPFLFFLLIDLFGMDVLLFHRASSGSELPRRSSPPARREASLLT